MKWHEIEECICDMQVDTNMKCIVVDLPYDRSEDNRHPESVREDIHRTLATLEIPAETTRIRLQEDNKHLLIPSHGVAKVKNHCEFNAGGAGYYYTACTPQGFSWDVVENFKFCPYCGKWAKLIKEPCNGPTG